MVDSKPEKEDRKGTRSHTYLETLVSKTKKFKVDDLLELYQVYDQLVIDFSFRHLLLPYVRFARTWLTDQAREILAGTDRNRLILTSRFRKATEDAYDKEKPSKRGKWAKVVKSRHTRFLSRVYSLMTQYANGKRFFSMEEVESLGVSRLVYDDMGSYYNALMNSYPEIVADYCAAMCDGDHVSACEIYRYIRALEAEVGIQQENAWYVTMNIRSIYKQIDEMTQAVTMAYSRLLFRFAHSLRGVTTTEENFSAGYEGMIRAARNYDPVDGSAFTSHCQWWARSAILQRQKQSSVISLPNTTWYQLGLLQKGRVEMDHGRESDLRERAEMFYASSSNANRAQNEDGDTGDSSFESIMVTSADASIVLGSSIEYAQAIVEGYETRSETSVSNEGLLEVTEMILSRDPSMYFPILLWALNSGVDVSLLSSLSKEYLLNEDGLAREAEQNRRIRKRCLGRNL